MAVPKKKTSRSRKGMRRAHDRITAPNVVYCECGEPVLPHRACDVCGNYKGRQVVNSDDA
ncbi:50S ribosomal protein L32 [Salidesulfovibrio brasiliensis]|uniref:50S ribosomal protein L32 n=1 Tax=Salidesulfovibrio brasiliensis TaxID=221711 RepID=UPI0006D0C9C6|nr:50S ribosomal protein L32 [Salidesulfovibrio brasiliensis]